MKLALCQRDSNYKADEKSFLTRISACLGFTCALQKEILYHGKMYVSNNYICFYSSVLLKETKVGARLPCLYWEKSTFFTLISLPLGLTHAVFQVVIPVSSVAILKKQNTALVVPNALSIRTTDGEKARIILLQRNAAVWSSG